MRGRRRNRRMASVREGTERANGGKFPSFFSIRPLPPLDLVRGGILFSWHI